MYSDGVYIHAVALTIWNNLQGSSTSILNSKPSQTLEIIGKKFSKSSQRFYVLCRSIGG